MIYEQVRHVCSFRRLLTAKFKALCVVLDRYIQSIHNIDLLLSFRDLFSLFEEPTCLATKNAEPFFGGAPSHVP